MLSIKIFILSGMLGRLEISRTITFLSTVGQSSTSCHQKCHHTQLLMARIDIPSNNHHLRHMINIQETMLNVFSNASVSKRSASRCSETSQTLTEEPEVAFMLLFYASFKRLKMITLEHMLT